MIDIVTIGWLTIDDIVLPNDTCHRQVIGGGALYSAIGARIWHDRVGIHSVTGEKYINTVTSEINQFGLDVTGLNSIGGSGLELWVLHETETEKQQVPKLTSSTTQEMDSGRRSLPEAYRGSRGFHIAPQTPASSIANVRYLSSFPSKPIITLDILVMRLLNNSDSFIFAKGCLPGSLDLSQDLLSFSPPDVPLGFEVMPGEVLHDGIDQLAHAAEAAGQDRLLAQVSEEAFDQIHPG